MFQKYAPLKIQPKKYAGKKKSIFANSPKFTLPSSSSENFKNSPQNKEIPDLQKPIIKHSEDHTEYDYPKEVVAPKQRKLLSPEKEKHINSTLSKYKHDNLFNKNKFRYFEKSKELKTFPTDIKNINEESDNKLMNLLDTLEQEVKYIELDGKEKQLFDAKLRKIYGTLVAKPKKGDPHSKPLEHTDFETTDNVELSQVLDLNHVSEDEESTNKIVNKQMSDTENRVLRDKHYSNIEYEGRQNPASQMYAIKDQPIDRPIARTLEDSEYMSGDPNFVLKTDHNFQNYKHMYYKSDDNMTPIENNNLRTKSENYKERYIYGRSDNYKLHEPYLAKKDYDRDREKLHGPNSRKQDCDIDRKKHHKPYSGKNDYDRDRNRDREKLHETYLENKVYQTELLDQRYDSENDIMKGRSMYKNEDYNDKDYKMPYLDYPTDGAKPHYEEENADGYLNTDRRQFYQEKLNKIQRKLQGVDDNVRHANVSFIF